MLLIICLPFLTPINLQTFMIPLERYLASLMPLARTISPFRAPPKVASLY